MANFSIKPATQWLNNFFVGLGKEYKEAWKDYSAPLFWTAIIAFFLGALFL